MKRIPALLLVISIVLTFTACDDGSASQNVDGNADSTVMTVATDLANEIDNVPLYGTVVSFSASPTDFTDFTLGLYYFASYDEYPRLYLKTKERDAVWSEQQIRQAVESVADELGLTVKEGELARYLKAYEERDTRSEEFEFANGFYGCDMNSAEYGMLKDMIENSDINIDTINAQISAVPMEFDAQNPEYEYFEFLKLELTGKAEVNADTGNLTLKTDNYPIGYGEYTLVCYVADSNNNRISRNMKIGAHSDVTLDLTNTYRGVTLNATADSVTVYNYIISE